MSLVGAVHGRRDGILPSTPLATISNWTSVARPREIAGRLDDRLSEWYGSDRAREESRSLEKLG
jgi:hypothetical protein